MKFILLCAVIFVSQVACKAPVDLGNIFTKGVSKTFEEDLSTHMKTIQELHNPLIDAFKQKGCEVPTKENAGSGPIIHRLQSCVSITELIGALEQSVLSGYYIANYYKDITLRAANHATACLQNEDLAVVVTCLLEAANNYGEYLGTANNFLSFDIKIGKYAAEHIVPSFNECFGTNVSTLNELITVHTERCKTNQLL